MSCSIDDRLVPDDLGAVVKPGQRFFLVSRCLSGVVVKPLMVFDCVVVKPSLFLCLPAVDPIGDAGHIDCMA